MGHRLKHLVIATAPAFPSTRHVLAMPRARSAEGIESTYQISAHAKPLIIVGAYRIQLFREVVQTNLRDSGAVCCCLRTGDFRQRPHVGCNGFGNDAAIDELPFTATSDQPGFA